uniref:Uncharacterized protein n=1 Tax=Chenopodium quinoa TaxID=63459 RepID=A0A803N920_CHEQI
MYFKFVLSDLLDVITKHKTPNQGLFVFPLSVEEINPPLQWYLLLHIRGRQNSACKEEGLVVPMKGKGNGKGRKVIAGGAKRKIVYEPEYSSCSSTSESSYGSMSDDDFEYYPESKGEVECEYSAVSSEEVTDCYSSGEEVRKAERKAKAGKRKVVPKVFVAMNVTCPVETLGRILGNFEDKKRLSRCVKKMLVVCGWTSVSIGPSSGALGLGDSIWSTSFTDEGIVVDPELGDRLWNTYSTTIACETRGITRKTLVEYLEGPCVDDKKFKMVFLMYMLNVMCSSTCHRLKKQFLHGVSVADNAAQYNWCEFVLANESIRTV